MAWNETKTELQKGLEKSQICKDIKEEIFFKAEDKWKWKYDIRKPIGLSQSRK